MRTLESTLTEQPPPQPNKPAHGTLDAMKYSQGIFKTRPGLNDSALTGKTDYFLETETDILTETERLNKIKHH